MNSTTEQIFVLGLIDKHSRRHRDGCPSSQVPLACKNAVQALIEDGAIESVRGGRDGTYTFLRRR